jgi:hypothetical protein
MKRLPLFYFVFLSLVAFFFLYGVFNLYVSQLDSETISRSLQGRYKWYSIASSIAGTYKSAVEKDGFLYLSTDRGDTWTVEVFDEPRDWRAVTSNADGSR